MVPELKRALEWYSLVNRGGKIIERLVKWNDRSGYQEAIEKTGTGMTVGSRDWGC